MSEETNLQNTTRALVIATGQLADGRQPSSSECMPMCSLADRPFLQHIVESLVHRGITRIDFVLCQQADAIESLLGDGVRWGATFGYHLVRTPDVAYSALERIQLDEDEGHLLVVQADRLAPSKWMTHLPEPDQCVVFKFRDEKSEATEWSGAAWLTETDVRGLANSADPDEFASSVMQLGETRGNLIGTERPLLAGDFHQLLESQERVLNGEFPELIRFGGQAAEQIWIQRNVRMHPATKLIAPVYIAPNCQIDGGVTIGPNVVLSEGCIVDRHCTIQNSVVLPKSYLGEGLDVDQSVIDKQTLLNLRYDVLVSIADDFIMGDLGGGGLVPALRRFFSRALSAIGAVLLSPVMLLTWVFMKLKSPGQVLQHREIVRLPSSGDSCRLAQTKIWYFGRHNEDPTVVTSQWGYFLRHFIPGLVSVARGRLHLVGVKPRTVEQVQLLSEDWRKLYLESRAGLITEPLVQFGRHADAEEAETAEAVYAVVSSWRHDLSLLAGFVGTLVFGPRVRKSDIAAQVSKADLVLHPPSSAISNPSSDGVSRDEPELVESV